MTEVFENPGHADFWRAGRDLLVRAAVGQALDRTSRIGYCDHRYKTEKQEQFTHSMA